MEYENSPKKSEGFTVKKVSVFFVLPDLEMGGAERIVTTIANHLPRDIFEPKIILNKKKGGYLDILEEDVEIIELNVDRIRNSLFPLLKEIKKRKPNIVFSGWGEISAFLSPFLFLFPKTKFIARETNVVSEHVTRKEIRFFYKFYNNFDTIICQSDDMQQDLLKNFNIHQEKIIKINNPVDFTFIDGKLSISTQPESYHSEFKNVVAIGNLSARKGFDNLLQVFAHLKDEKIRLHILGDGRDKDLLNQLKNDLGLENVIFHGQQKNPYQFLKFADLFILSPRYEGFPNVLLEAGACGTYSLANNCPGGISEIIQPKINGEISKIEDYEEFSNKILEILSEKYDETAIRNSIQSRFSKEIILEKYVEIFNQI